MGLGQKPKAAGSATDVARNQGDLGTRVPTGGDKRVPDSSYNEGHVSAKKCCIVAAWNRVTQVVRRLRKRSGRVGPMPKAEEREVEDITEHEIGKKEKNQEIKRRTETRKDSFLTNPWHPEKIKKPWIQLICPCLARKESKVRALRQFGPHKDGDYFESLVDAEEDKLIVLITAKDIKTLEEHDGKTLVAIKEAKSLFGTFRGFRKCCKKNVEQRAGAAIPLTDGGPTLDEDLQNIWSLIMKQAEVVHEMFRESKAPIMRRSKSAPQLRTPKNQKQGPKNQRRGPKRNVDRWKVPTERDAAARKMLFNKRHNRKVKRWQDIYNQQVGSQLRAKIQAGLEALLDQKKLEDAIAQHEVLTFQPYQLLDWYWYARREQGLKWNDREHP